MKSLFLKGTENTPEFKFDVKTSIMEIEGNCSIEKDNSFFFSITKFISNIESSNSFKLNLNLNFSHLCKSSKRGLLFFLIRLKEIQCISEIKINWEIDAENHLLQSIAENLEYMVRIPINIKITVKLNHKEEISEVVSEPSIFFNKRDITNVR